ncbi:MAG: hypothetical protein WCI17_04825 [bacterium]
MLQTRATALRIFRLGNDPVVAFAATEIQQYLRRMTGRTVPVSRRARFDPAARGIWLGLGVACGDAVPDAVRQPADGADDAIFVRAHGGRVLLAGRNPRSVLFATYRWLESLGCRWLRPGRDGERVPKMKDPLSVSVELEEVPSTRHRCICLEGSASIEHVLDYMDYAAKRGCNGFFPQFFDSFPVFDRWYGVERNRAPRRTPFSARRAAALTRRIHRETFRRGLMLHTAGHGWTCRVLGLPEAQWHAHGQVPGDAVGPLLAQVNGERGYSHGGKPLFTQLCYGNPAVQRRLVQAVVEHADRHPDEAYLHVWLGDGGNNHCECPLCRPHRPSDLYVRILNAIDAEMTRRRLKQRLVFCAYTDLLWAPVRERITNPGRFLLLFAPISRSYLSSFAEQAARKPAPAAPYRRNRNALPSSLAGNLALVNGWSRAFTGERIIYEYHFWRQYHDDPAGMRTARIVQQDVQALPALDLAGFIGVGGMRVAFPTGIGLEVQGRMLWDRTLGFDTMAGRYFDDLFGTAGAKVHRYLEQLTRLMSQELINPADGRSSDRPERQRALRNWARVAAVVEAFQPEIRAGQRGKDRVTVAAWKILAHHAWYAKAQSELYGLIYRQDAQATPAYAAFARELARRQPELQHVLDGHTCRMMTQHALAMQGLPFEEWIVVPAGGAW